MDFGMAMAAYQAVGATVTGITGSKAAKRVASAQRKTADKMYQYNKKQVSDAYAKAYSNSMSNYIDNRRIATQQYDKVKSDLNVYISENNIMLEDSSYFGEAENQLDLEFNTNLENLFGNMVSQTGALASNKIAQEYQLGNQYLNQKRQIDNTLNNVNTALMNNVLDKVGLLATETVSDYQSAKSKGESGYSLGDYFSNFGFNK